MNELAKILFTLGMVFLCGGIAIWLEASFLLASIVLGAVIANLSRHHERPLHAIEGIERPFMILFFVLAGASLHMKSPHRFLKDSEDIYNA